MKLSKLFFQTLREDPQEAEIKSHKLMLRAALMRKLSAGVYAYLPLGLKALRKIEGIIREEMDKAGAQELLMPALLPSDYYVASGRWEVFGDDMFRLKDRNKRDFCLGPTHEEIFCDTVKSIMKSYKQLPMTLYQIQTKYRDERRPRFGVIRSREFVMKDAYSFDKNQAELDISYKQMDAAYRAILARLELDFMVVDADAGAMGGSGSQEFMLKSEVGEDLICYCQKCSYAANVEKAPCESQERSGDLLPMEEANTPNVTTIAQVAEFLGKSPSDCLKTLIYHTEEQLVAVVLRGDRELNTVKLCNLLGVAELTAASDAQMEEAGLVKGFIGPIGLPHIKLVVDKEAAGQTNMVIGANKADTHYINANPTYEDAIIADVRCIQEGDKCPVCQNPVSLCRGIEVGHIFKLGTKYSDSMGLTYLDAAGKELPVVMGSYGIGVSRLIAAIVEQNSDDNGIMWPMDVAPYKVAVVPTRVTDDKIMGLAEHVYNQLIHCGIDAVLDDRDERPGVKFKDIDLIGIPIRITVGRDAAQNIVELKQRHESESKNMQTGAAVAEVIKLTSKES